jgi:mannosyl-3-phosphoglycerate phosphatase
LRSASARGIWPASGSKQKSVPRSRKRRSFAISKRTRTLVFTDLDGTLLDQKSYSWAGASQALEQLRRQNIPLIFCTSKTQTEVKAIRRAIGNTHPFIVENGGAIIIPAGYFPDVAPFGTKAKAFTMIIGRPYQELVRELRRLSQDTGIAVRGFHQMSDQELARETGLTVREAHMARQRETGEPFLFRDATAAEIRAFSRKAQARGYSALRGGRFWHLSGGCDKGLALSVLIGFFRTAWQTRIITVALGDSGNDLPMFRLVDRPILIPKLDGSFASEVIQAMPRIRRARKSGPEGWAAAVLDALRQRKRATNTRETKALPAEASSNRLTYA